MTMTEEKIRIAVIGGGIAGVTVANALARHAHIDLNVYEAAPYFSERGAGIGLSNLALAALDEILPSATELLKSKAKAVAVRPARIVIVGTDFFNAHPDVANIIQGLGSTAGTIVCDIDEDSGLAMNRAPLLSALLESLPAEALHTNQKLTSLEESSSGVRVTFEDGSSRLFDAVIGADGLYSSVRRFIHGAEAEQHAASPAGWWDCRNLVPINKAKAMLGELSFEVDREYCWVGDGAFIMHAVVESGTMVQCVIAVVETNHAQHRKRPISRETFRDVFGKGWQGLQVAKGMIELMLDQESPCGYSIWEHKTTPSYAKGCLCIMGEAAHTTSPWQGAGAGLAVEDALILGHLFGAVSSREQVEAVFKAFDGVRRPRCQSIIDSGRASGQLFCGQNSNIGLDPVKMGEEIGTLYTELDALKIDSHKQAALEQLQLFLGDMS
jgi:salicylate hydroxylase